LLDKFLDNCNTLRRVFSVTEESELVSDFQEFVAGYVSDEEELFNRPCKKNNFSALEKKDEARIAHFLWTSLYEKNRMKVELEMIDRGASREELRSGISTLKELTEREFRLFFNDSLSYLVEKSENPNKELIKSTFEALIFEDNKNPIESFFLYDFSQLKGVINQLNS
jgi:hypothetical protein